MMHLKPTLKPGDTVHFDVIDRFGNSGLGDAVGGLAAIVADDS